LFVVAGIVTAPLAVLLLLRAPRWPNQPSIWFGWPGAPLLWDSVAVALFVLLGLALLWVGALPDLADRRDRGAGGVLTGWLALGWTGSAGRWRTLSRALIVLGALYLMLYAFVHLLLSSDLALSLVPPWGSAIFPAYQAISGLQGGVAAAIVALAAARVLGRLGATAHRDAFHGAAKLLLALSLLVFYLLWAEFITYWYAPNPEERWVLGLFLFGPTLWLFLASFGLTVVLPFLLLLVGAIRASPFGTTLVAALVLVGTFVDRVRIYLAAWTVAGPVPTHGEGLPPLPTLAPPNVADLTVMVGVPAAVATLYLLALRYLPPISLWEAREALLLRAERREAGTEVLVVAKPA
jgi:hypothetical protein